LDWRKRVNALSLFALSIAQSTTKKKSRIAKGKSLVWIVMAFE